MVIGVVVYVTLYMNKHTIIGITAVALLLVGAGCGKKTEQQEQQPGTSAPAGDQQSATSTAPGTNEQDGKGAGAEGEVRIDLRQDTSASPKASAGGEPAQQNQQSSQQSNPSNQNTGAGTGEQQPALNVPATKSFSITATQWAFSPNTITVKQGDTVRMRVTSLDVPHGIMIPEYDINKVLNVNETVMFDFVADKKGTFTFRCSVQCGSGHSTMTGKLVVE